MKEKSQSSTTGKMILWLIGFIAISGTVLAALGSIVVKVDPFFHYGLPQTDTYYYLLYSERNQNDGIGRYFDYDAMITGTSMAQCFKTSEFDSIFGVHSVKTTFSGGSFKEIGDHLKRSLSANSDIKTIIRSLDMDYFFFDYNDLGTMADGDYPDYLYDDNIFNDYKYVLSRDIIFDRAYKMMTETESAGFEPGITSFDVYSNWMSDAITFGAKSVCPTDIKNYEPVSSSLSSHEKNMIRRNITRNITEIANAYPDTQFYYYVTPYSAVWWNAQCANGVIGKQIEAERYIIELMLECDNIHLYSFNTNFALTTNLNNYKDAGHYGEWVNTAILQWMYDGEGLLTKENYQQYLAEELEFYQNYDYTQLLTQEDYEEDSKAEGALLGLTFTADDLKAADVRGAEIGENPETGAGEIICKGTLNRKADDDLSIERYLYDVDYVGVRLTVDDISSYSELTFSGTKVTDHGMPVVVVYDEEGNLEAEFALSYSQIDSETYEYSLNVSWLTGKAVIIFNGGYLDEQGSQDSQYIFSDISLN